MIKKKITSVPASFKSKKLSPKGRERLKEILKVISQKRKEKHGIV